MKNDGAMDGEQELVDGVDQGRACIGAGGRTPWVSSLLPKPWRSREPARQQGTRGDERAREMDRGPSRALGRVRREPGARSRGTRDLGRHRSRG
jgi:hypothetical protein